MIDLPIYQVLDELKTSIQNSPTVVLQAPPGAGKTTVVPLELLDAPWLKGRKIIILEPRRLAAKTAAYRMAEQLNESVGQTVGYRVRMESKVSAQTRIEVVTEGILTRRIQNDPDLSDIGLIIFDEFHERSINADLGLALSLEVQQALRDDLRIIIMSATIDGDRITRDLGDIPLISSSGKCYPVETIHVKSGTGRALNADVASTVIRALRENTGSILVFLPGVGEIREVESVLKNGPVEDGVDICPLYGNLTQDEQQKAISPSPGGRRKVVLATSIAETSLTIEGVSVVIDSGMRRVPKYDPNSGMTRLETQRVSKSAAEQRRGRAGRMEPGTCYRLWTDSVERSLAEHSTPEILEAELSTLVLELAQWGVRDSSELFWLDIPPVAAVNEAQILLKSLNAIDSEGAITTHGRKMLGLGIHPRLAHMIIKGAELGQAKLACELAAIISERDFLRFAFGDGLCCISTRIDALRAFESNGAKRFNSADIDKSAARRILELAKLWERKLVPKAQQKQDIDLCGVLLGFAYSDRIGKQRKGDATRYLLSNGRGAHFDHHDALVSSEYIVVANLAGRDKDAKIFLAADISIKQINSFFNNDCEKHEFIIWDDRDGCVKARKQLKLGELVLEDKPLTTFDNELAVAAVIDAIKNRGLSSLSWDKETTTLRARMDFLHRTMPDEWPDVSDEALLESIDQWLAPYLNNITRESQFNKIDLKNALLSLLDWKKRGELDTLAPTHIQVPAGPNIRLDYLCGDIPVLPVKLQMMFGAMETPRIAGGKVAVLLHLLSPAQRPVQITQDLAGFWSGSYELVKKDLKGRYPKHDWPDSPQNAVPVCGAKKRNL